MSSLALKLPHKLTDVRKAGLLLRSLAARHQNVMNVLMFGTLYGAAELSQQRLTGRRHHDYNNAARVATVGGLCIAPLYQYYYKWVDTAYPKKLFSVICKKILIEQVFLSPVIIAIFLAGTCMLERKGNPIDEVSEKLPKTYLARCMFWPMAQAVNFAFVPAHLRVTYVACAAFVWINILCYIKSHSTAGFPWPSWRTLTQPRCVLGTRPTVLTNE